MRNVVLVLAVLALAGCGPEIKVEAGSSGCVAVTTKPECTFVTCGGPYVRMRGTESDCGCNPPGVIEEK